MKAFASRSRRVRVGRISACALAIGLGAVGLASVPTSAAPASISGTVFRDLDHNGSTDPGEEGWADVTVTATASDGTVATTTSASDGTYEISGLDDTLTYRVTFEWAEPWLTSGPIGPDNGSSEQFVPGGGIANFAVVNAQDFCGVADDELDFATTCFINGDPLAPGTDYSGQEAIVSIHGEAQGRAGAATAQPQYPTIEATNSVIGSTYGLAWQPSQERLFSAAFLKRHVGLGEGGIDAIYEISQGSESVWYEAIDAGTVPSNSARDLSISNDDPPSLDPDTFGLIYKTGWGDIDLSADESTLFATNLFDRSIYAIDVVAADAGSTSAHVSLGRPSHSCPGGAARPFAIEVHDGTLWASVTCTAETSDDRADLSAAIYGFDLAAGTWSATPALSFPLDYTKGCGQHSNSCGFEPWTDVYTDAAFGINPNPSAFEGPRRPQPIVSDLEIDQDGSLIIAVRDRVADQFGHRNLSPADDGNLVTGYSSGDILRAAPQGPGWVLESNGSVGGLTSAGSGVDQTGPGGPNTNQGPGGGEFYADDYVLNGSTEFHSETAMGSLALAPGRSDVATTIYDPLNNRLDAAGIAWFSNTDGATTHEYELYRDAGNPQPSTFGKANGLGDLEAMCPGAPVQIGDRVWFDRNNDGIQDPDEPGIPGVKVMVDGVTLITDANGQWSYTVEPNTSYQVMIDPSMADVSLIPEVDDVSELLPTVADSQEDERLDSDMDPATLKIEVLSGAPGDNDHSFDAGFYVEPGSLELGNLVWLDSNNNGVAEMGEDGIADVAVELWTDADDDGEKDTRIAQTVTNADGYYLFDGLAKDVYFVVIPAQNGPGEPLAGLSSSTPTTNDPDDDTDNDDNGMPIPIDDGVMSGPVSLMEATEPTDEVSRDGKDDRDLSPTGLPDDSSNLSVDFGFFPTAKLGDFVWIDANNDGVQGQDEAPVEGVTVHLCDADMNPLETTVTDANGMYMFSGLAPGGYMTCLDLDTVPAGLVLTAHNAGDDDTLDSDGDPATGKTQMVEIGAGEFYQHLDFGLVATEDSPVTTTEPPVEETSTSEPPASTTEPPVEEAPTTTEPPASTTEPPAEEPTTTEAPAPTTAPPTTEPPVTEPPTTAAPTTATPTTAPPSTVDAGNVGASSSTARPTTQPATTQPPTTRPPTTQPTTEPPVTQLASTAAPETAAPSTAAAGNQQAAQPADEALPVTGTSTSALAAALSMLLIGVGAGLLALRRLRHS